jgi:hypothetical protein
MSDLQGPRIPGEERSRRGLTTGRIILALVILALLALLIPLACQALRGSDTEESSQGASQEEATEETTTSESAAASDTTDAAGSGAASGEEDGAQSTTSAEISSLEDQSGDGTTLTVGSATISGIDGWLAVHRDDGNDSPQVPQSIGQAPLQDGENADVVVTLDEPVSSSQTLHAMIHADDPADETYTFPDGDPPVEVNGGVVVEPLQYTVGDERADSGMANREPLPKSGGLGISTFVGGSALLLAATLLAGTLLLIRRT